MKDLGMLPERVTEMLAKSAGIEINGSSPWDIQVKDDRWFARVWNDKGLGLGESYMDGWWDCERLDEMFCRLLRADVEGKVRSNLRHLLRQAPGVVFNLQSRRRARVIAERHYDLGNDLFTSFVVRKEHLCLMAAMLLQSGTST